MKIILNGAYPKGYPRRRVDYYPTLDLAEDRQEDGEVIVDSKKIVFELFIIMQDMLSRIINSNLLSSLDKDSLEVDKFNSTIIDLNNSLEKILLKDGKSRHITLEEFKGLWKNLEVTKSKASINLFHNLFDKRKKIHLLDTHNLWTYDVICKKCGVIDKFSKDELLMPIGAVELYKIINAHVC